MNIAIFTNNYLPNPYGVTVSVETFREELEKRGHTVYIFAPKWKDYVDTNPRVFRYPSIDIEFKFRFPLAIPYSWRMRRILKNLKIDVIHSQHPNLLGSAGRRFAKKKKIPLVFTWHTLYDHYTNFVPLIPKKWAADYITQKAVAYANNADVVIAPTASIIPILRKWGVKKEIIPIATGIKAEKFVGADREGIRKKLAIAPDEIVLFLVSRLTGEKNIEFVFRALKNILADCPLGKEGSGQSAGCVKLLVTGEGYLLPKLKKYCVKEKITESVIFTGFISPEEIKNYFAASDIFVHSSKSETQGIVPLEAMYMGLPVVAVDSTGISSLMLNKANGFLVGEDEKEFSGAVLKLIKDADLRKRFGEASGKIARENFTSEVSADKLLKVYESAIDDRKKIGAKLRSSGA
ncbi:MAG: glycosyltransferase [Candidatus Moranbacteria bacterium]|nr:glycosyltransferase [Candidatus Moranbacteria bacterium]